MLSMNFWAFFERHRMGDKRYAPDCTFFDSPCFVVSSLQRMTMPRRHASPDNPKKAHSGTSNGVF